jgi:hypothetical protein
MNRLLEFPMLWRWTLAIWTLGIWAGRLRNIVLDDDLSGTGRAFALGVAAGFVLLALALVLTLTGQRSGQRTIVDLLVGAGILRWTMRGPLVLASDEWSNGFKVVHTVLWITTVVVSVLAWREMRRRSS